MTSPAIRALRESISGATVTLLTSPAGARAGALIPEVDETLVYEAPWMKGSSPREHAATDHAMAAKLRGGGFDGAVIFTVYSQNPLPAAFLCHLAEIPLRLAHCHENPYQLLTDWVPDPEPADCVRHEVRRQLDLVAAIGCTASHDRLSVRVTDAARRSIGRRLNRTGLRLDRTWIAMHPGASAPARRYRAEGYAAVARALVLDQGWQVVFTGDADEVGLVEEVRRSMGAPSLSLAGQLDLAELAALLEAAPLLISNNTAPVHMAAAVGTAVVDVYALTNPQHTPWGVPYRVVSHDVPCRWCYKSVCPLGHHDCLRLVSPHEIVMAALELMDQLRPTVPSLEGMSS
jgi:lipopolysaccharide heptosyltransferase II